MFILEEPYVSELLLKTLEKNRFEVADNKIANGFLRDYKLNLTDFDTVLREENSGELKLYSNSENSINDVIEKFPNSEVARLIKLCKDKYEFRKSLASVYPHFFFRRVSVGELESVDISDLPESFIIKPSVGFLSMGVHKVNSRSDWSHTAESIKSEIKTFKENFPDAVLSSENFIIEQIIRGEEFALDAYFDENGEPVILNIFKHPFADENDVSDRVYISSSEIIRENSALFNDVLSKIGKVLNIKNFPMHIEVIKEADGSVIPVEINPMRFAGWCTTDLAYYAYGINIYEYFVNNLKPDWDKVLEGKEGKIYYFAMADVPQEVERDKIKFDYETFKELFSNILEFRKIDYTTKPLFAILFCETSDESEITRVLRADMKKYL